MGEKELVISTHMPEEYIEEDEEALETSFQSLEVAEATSFDPENPTPSLVEDMAFQVMIKEGYQLGKGLGPYLNGISTPITIQENVGKAGLSYQGGNQTLANLTNQSRTKARKSKPWMRWKDGQSSNLWLKTSKASIWKTK
ncbi:hypothetical protein CR513_25404, partial [Mucuna pruriens]